MCMYVFYIRICTYVYVCIYILHPNIHMLNSHSLVHTYMCVLCTYVCMHICVNIRMSIRMDVSNPLAVPYVLQLRCTSPGPFRDEMQRVGRGLSLTDTRRRATMGGFVRLYSRLIGATLAAVAPSLLFSSFELLFSSFELRRSKSVRPGPLVIGIGTGLTPSV